jgi:hypothetical protein
LAGLAGEISASFDLRPLHEFLPKVRPGTIRHRTPKETTLSLTAPARLPGRALRWWLTSIVVW